MTKIQLMAVGVFALCAASPAFSQTTTNVPIGVDLSLAQACRLETPTTVSLDFLNVSNPATQTADIDVDTGNINLVCNVASIDAAVGIDGGNNASGGLRRLANPAATGTGQYVAYHLYTISGRTSASEYVIGNKKALDFGFGVGIVPANADLNFTIYARIIASDIRLAATGTFTDVLLLTLFL